MKNEKFYFEMTDMFGGEKNYCWIKRFSVTAKTERGALLKIGKETGLHFRKIASGPNEYKAEKACIVLYLLDACYGMEITNDWIERAIDL